MTSLTAIFARDLNGVIGVNNTLPWHQPRDLKFFKDTTIDHIVVMGYNTFESMNFKPLPDRINVVLTSKSNILVDRTVDSSNRYPDVVIFNKIEDVIKFVQDKKAFVIGGFSVFTQFQPYLDEVIETVIRTEVPFTENMTFVDVDYLIKDMSLVSSDFFDADEHNYDQTINIYRK